MTCVFYGPRSIEPLPAAGDRVAPQMDKPHVTALALCSSNGWAETDLDESPPRFDRAVDRPGPISVAVAVERGGGAALDVHIRPTRLVVFGDSDFVSNGALAGGNLDLFMSALNWLLERDRLMAIAPKAPDELRFDMTLARVRLLFVVVVLLLPAAVALAGHLVWLRRRR